MLFRNRFAIARLFPLATGSLLSLACLMPGYAQAQDYLGGVCLQGTVKERESGPIEDQTFTVKYEVNHMGGTSYALSGNVDIPGQPFIFTGFGTQIGTILYMNITTTQSHKAPDNWRDSGVMQVQLDLTTMTSTFFENGHDFDTDTRQWDNRFTAGIISKVACP